ncbi:MAG TPA: molecular chaperone TorD family protein [Pyrinomonadaceae bacterium]|nr:molecular chaperone TorD family protein [Pyrinomonadaceae bacterium]
MELFRALAVLAEPPVAEAARVAEALELGPMPGAAAYTELFVFELYPYASAYLGAEGMLGGEARDRVAGFWRALGETPPAEPDHLSVMLALYARLVEMEESERDAVRRAGLRGARRAFLWEHILSWLPVYLTKLSETASDSFYRRWGEILSEALREEAKSLGAQAQLPIHLREAAALGLVDPREGSVEDFLQSLLAPVRSGMILLRSDLSRAARHLRLGLRLGERRFILKALFSQDGAGVLEWLSMEADAWVERHRLQRGSLGAVAVAWEEKAVASANLLKELGRAARLEKGSVRSS